MKFKTFAFTTTLIASLLSQAAFAEQKTILLKNQRGSILELTFLADNKISGYITTAVASKSCPQAINSKRPISGYKIGNAITYNMFYPMCNSVVSVSGNFDEKEQTLDTIFILNKQSSDITHEGPGARFIGNNFYTKINKK